MATMPPHRHGRSQPPVRPVGARRVVHRLLTLVAAVAVGAGLVAAPAHAAPSVDEIEAQIDKQWEQLEPTIEGYNKIRAQLKVNQKKSADLQKKMAPLELQSALAMNRVGDLASRYYMQGPSQEVGALLVDAKPGTLAEQLTILDRLAAEQRKQVAGVLAIRDKYNREKQKLDALIAIQVKQRDEMAAKKKQIDAEIKRLTASLPKTTVKVAGCPTINGVVSSAAQTAIRVACQQVGDPYVWGATGPNSFDCSGLMYWAFKKVGITLPRSSTAQSKVGRPVAKGDLQPGDMVFFYTPVHHVGFYAGNGKVLNAVQTGDVVRYTDLSRMHFNSARRI